MKQVNFSKIFGEIYGKHNKELNSLKKETFIKEIILVIILILICRFVFISGIRFKSAFVITMIIIVIGIILLDRISRKYIRDFKQKAIRILVESQNDTYEYKCHQGISPVEYNESGFDQMWDKFYSEDYISGKLGEMVNFEMSQVKTMEEHETTGSDGRRQKNTVTTFLRFIWNNNFTCI